MPDAASYRREVLARAIALLKAPNPRKATEEVEGILEGIARSRRDRGSAQAARKNLAALQQSLEEALLAARRLSPMAQDGLWGAFHCSSLAARIAADKAPIVKAAAGPDAETALANALRLAGGAAEGMVRPRGWPGLLKDMVGICRRAHALIERPAGGQVAKTFERQVALCCRVVFDHYRPGVANTTNKDFRQFVSFVYELATGQKDVEPERAILWAIAEGARFRTKPPREKRR